MRWKQVSKAELENFIGPNLHKYLRKFDKFEQRNGRDALTWHWPAFFFAFPWLLYRKMYRWAVVAIIVWPIPYVGLLASFAFGLSGNYLYYKYCNKRIPKVIQKAGPVDPEIELRGRGGETDGCLGVSWHL